MAKHIFVTGGVVSGLGKGITAASLGRLLKARGFKVASQKLDPYMNVDPGTMSPLQHGEVFVTNDGAETDLDLGHYERFIDENLSKNSNNIFGVKADARWNGKVVEVNTSENYDDKIVAKFRKYDSIKDSINDHGKFLTENKRYEESGLFKATHYTTQAQALEDAGYATKKNEDGELIYADILIDLIKKYNLQLLDREVQEIK